MVKMCNLEKFDVFLFAGVQWIWYNKNRGGIYECDGVNDKGASLLIGQDSNEIQQEVEVVGRMEFVGEHTKFDLTERTRLRNSLRELSKNEPDSIP